MSVCGRRFGYFGHRGGPAMAVDQIKRLYESMPAKLDRARKRFGRALTLSEKILVAHADDFDKQEWSRGKAQLRLGVLENYAFPGGLMIGADSHTPNSGGLGMVAIGVGGADCGEAMAGLAWE